MMRYTLSIICCLIISATIADAQTSQDSIYAHNIKQARLNGVYIPTDMADAYNEFTKKSSASSLEKFKSAPEDVVAAKLHLGLGKWLASTWNFHEGSRFSAYLKSMGVSFPDDMIPFTIVSFHRLINDQELELEERAKVFEQKRKKEHEERLKAARTISKRKVTKG